MEKVFLGTIKNLKSYKNLNLKNYFLSTFLEIPYVLPDCHQLKQKICKRWAAFRLKVHLKRKKKNLKNDFCYVSKTMAMHARIK